jgi:hypothetical protein
MTFSIKANFISSWPTIAVKGNTGRRRTAIANWDERPFSAVLTLAVGLTGLFKKLRDYSSTVSHCATKGTRQKDWRGEEIPASDPDILLIFSHQDLNLFSAVLA